MHAGYRFACFTYYTKCTHLQIYNAKGYHMLDTLLYLFQKKTFVGTYLTSVKSICLLFRSTFLTMIFTSSPSWYFFLRLCPMMQ